MFWIEKFQSCAVLAAGKCPDAVARVNLDEWRRRSYDEAQADVDVVQRATCAADV
jgi:hypothetical protein